MTYYRCETMDGRIIAAKTPTWFGQELPKYVELVCLNCGKTYSRDILRLVRPDVQEHCTCGEPIPQMRYITELKGDEISKLLEKLIKSLVRRQRILEERSLELEIERDNEGCGCQK